MLTCEKIPATELSDRDIATWRDMQAATRAFASPLLSPEFVQAVAAVREDVRVAVFRRGNQTVGFLALHMRPNRFARPAGAPFADYSALITYPMPCLNIGEALQAAGIDQYQAIGLIDPYRVFGFANGESDDAYGIDLRDDAPGNKANKKLVKNIRRLTRHMADNHGEVRFITGDRDRGRFDAMIRLKRLQTQETGLHDFLAAPWVRELLDRLFAAPDSGLHGYMVTLMAGDTPVLYHYGIRLGDRAHPWVSSYDPAFAAYSPGQIFLNDAPEALRQSGLSYYDLSTGHQSYKTIFSNTHFPVKHARFYSDAQSARLGAAIANVTTRTRRALGPSIDMAVTRLGRRLDHIATLELDTLSRLRGVAYAFSNAGKRRRVNDNG